MSLSDDGSARIELETRNPSLELSVVASRFRVVERGLGSLSVSVKPGIYEVVARAGPVVRRNLIKLRAGDVYRDRALIVQFPATAPVPETTTTHEYQQQAVEDASAALSQRSGPMGGLLIVVRDVRGLEGPPLDAADVAPFSLFGSSQEPVPGFEQGWDIKAAEAIATWSARLAPGGYALRTDPARASGRTGMDGTPFVQSVWVSEGWQTIVFITTGEGGPQTQSASVHMAGLGEYWLPYEYELGLALELANWSLREGRSVVPTDLLRIMLNAKFKNPMLGIVGAHCLLLDPDPPPELTNTVLTNLGGLVPGHPDVAALRWIAARAGVVAGPMPGAVEPGAGVTWPPMLLPSYRALIEMDVIAGDAIDDDSVAERAAAQLYVQGIWTSWTPLLPPAELPPSATPEAAARVQSSVAADPSVLSSVPRDDPATERVAGYLAAVAAFEGSEGRPERFATLSEDEIALATTLPSASVRQALRRIGGALPPPTTPGWLARLGGSGLAAIGALVLLGAGAVGGVAWCAGSEDCPFRAGVPAPTAPPPTAQPTAAPTAAPTFAPTASPTREASPEPTVQPTLGPPETPFPLRYNLEMRFEPATVGSYVPRETFFAVTAEPGVNVLEIPLRFEIDPNSAPGFSVTDPCDWVSTENGGHVCESTISFSPLRVDLQTGTLLFHAGGEIEARRVTMSGDGLAPTFRAFPPPLFDVPSFQSSITLPVFVQADEPLLLSFSIFQNPPLAFFTESVCASWVEGIEGGYICRVNVTYAPPDTGQHGAVLEIRVGELDPVKVEIFGAWTVNP